MNFDQRFAGGGNEKPAEAAKAAKQATVAAASVPQASLNDGGDGGDGSAVETTAAAAVQTKGVESAKQVQSEASSKGVESTSANDFDRRFAGGGSSAAQKTAVAGVEASQRSSRGHKQQVVPAGPSVQMADGRRKASRNQGGPKYSK